MFLYRMCQILGRSNPMRSRDQTKLPWYNITINHSMVLITPTGGRHHSVPHVLPSGGRPGSGGQQTSGLSLSSFPVFISMVVCIYLWWSVSMVVYLWWCIYGGVSMVGYLWWCIYGGLYLWWSVSMVVCIYGGVSMVVYLWWCIYGGLYL